MLGDNSGCRSTSRLEEVMFIQHERSNKNDVPFPDFNGFYKSALQAFGWRIIDGAVQVSRCATPTKPSRSKDRVGWTVPKGFYLDIYVDWVA